MTNASDLLQPNTDVHGPELEFDFPGMRIGVAEYAEGPTGTTVFHFPDKAVAVVDVRGGMPGTYNVDTLRLGYDFPFLDAVVVSGGSWYGLEAAGGVAAALKEDGLRSGDWRNLANVAGAIIYDLGDRRPNEIVPDARLGAAALRAARPNRFALGARGAGRMAMQGGYFGLRIPGGQGAAFRQVSATKIAAFVVANPLGLIVGRDGLVSTGAGRRLPVSQLLQGLPLRRNEFGQALEPVAVDIPHHPGAGGTTNTTISLVVTNQILPVHALQRLATQVHGSMGRGVQPFATAMDGDVLFAASTQAVGNLDLHPSDLATLAAETMWDALISVTTARLDTR